ncbi:MAG: hypothetical protein HY936_02455 [Nitrosomonadales bacterium]|nr:hypothetical protein [Nitrosomonadales bacterium]
MKNILKDTENELVIAIRSPLVAWVGGLGIFFLLYLAYLLITQGRSEDERIIGLAGASATCALFFFAGYEKSDFSFDLQTRILAWSRRRGFFRRNGTVPFAAIERVVLQSCMGNDRYYPSHRVALITSNGELPLTAFYEHDDMNEVIAERIRSFLAMPPGSLLEDSVESFVESGRNVDAIRLLREKSGISLAEAHNTVARIKDGKGSDKPPRNGE